MVTKEEMAQAYIEQIKAKIVELNAQVKALEKHLEECNLELENQENEEG